MLAALFFVACDGPPEMATTGNGELHEGEFAYACTTPADAECADGRTPAGLPSGIALSADFELRFTPTSPVPTTLEPAPDFFSVDGTGRFHAKRAGYGVVLVKNDRGSVVDFVNLRVKAIASLAITGMDTDAPITPGETRTLSAAPVDATGAALAGTVLLEWESSDPSVVTVAVSDDDRARGGATLSAMRVGAARVRVVSGNATSAISVRVGGA